MLKRFSCITLVLVLALIFVLTAMPMTEAYAASNVIDIAATNPPSSGDGWTRSGNVFTIRDGANVTITGTRLDTNHQIVVAAGANVHITFDNFSMRAASGTNFSQFVLRSNSTTSVTSTGGAAFIQFGAGPGINLDQSAHLIVNGPLNVSGGGINHIGSPMGGRLTVNGGRFDVWSNNTALQSGNRHLDVWHATNARNITINGGLVTLENNNGRLGRTVVPHIFNESFMVNNGTIFTSPRAGGTGPGGVNWDTWGSPRSFSRDQLSRFSRIQVQADNYIPGPPTPSVDKTRLQALVDYADALSPADYTPDSWAAMQIVLAQAKAVLADANATQAEVDAMYDRLEAAIDALIKVIGRILELEVEGYSAVINHEANTITFNVPASAQTTPGVFAGNITRLTPVGNTLTFLFQGGTYAGYGPDVPPAMTSYAGFANNQQVFFSNDPDAVVFNVIVNFEEPTFGPDINSISIGGIPGEIAGRTITFRNVPRSMVNANGIFEGALVFDADHSGGLYFFWNGQHGPFVSGRAAPVGVESGVSWVYLIPGQPQSGYRVYFELGPEQVQENRITRLEVMDVDGTSYRGVFDHGNGTITFDVPASVMSAGIFVGIITELETDCATALPLTIENIHGIFPGFGKGINTSFLDGSIIHTSNKNYTVIFTLI